ncbi:bifunctional [glutamate--ammonia ligase]-adenylyl-L-tyrosine phosphorylase/[glutamate--ammonia-ligase] adenylyltransferase [Simiduia curdlanivorans]|uniref:Bifunctional glutamine synthetase adenylyltransferase/adenylyl-removing enzyme n=1 Tax=Simiduia curdlanivorans TaxID=1492769 RepID=A0ABV8V2I9_9GAMM|nr:bifunctional [glutamate--ammonia ligase]-adenylyl-L-tyrosine phosphorylase/[glutamate--ammonia-ligase] adenylyltransferase [Simiduia curdlanivorans]MDN3637782.1 bifunctional [glutamate--ammonia ligase]-adenylyl-L-tyrosine phosphorylase/[glutamate--ammonia-ligase] adenylyltransferase [Simiduia curdlanivorans]
MSDLPLANISALPPSLAKIITSSLTGIAGAEALADVERLQLARLLLASDYAAQQLQNHPEWLAELMQSANAARSPFKSQVVERLSGDETEDDFNRLLRQFRQQQQLRIILREFNGLASVAESTADLTELASHLIEVALAWHYPKLCQQFGTPVGRQSGLPQAMVVLGMGKLGAWELNLSSDIDLIFAFPESGETQFSAEDSGRKPIDNQQFFLKLGQRLIKSLDTVTVDGFCFRIDMRLRPHGDSGALVSNFNAIEDYYQTQGRDWERFAMIKARPVAWVGQGGAQAADKLMALLTPFTYRKYVDFSAFDSLRSMKTMISREVHRKGLQEDVKLGAGGIREVEFIGQAFQLIRGGRDEQLRERRVLPLLALLAEWELIPLASQQALSRAYEFLRHTEHAIQALADKQTQSLPMEPALQARFAWVMGFESWDSFYQTLEQHRQLVHQEFKAVIADPDGEAEAAEESDIVQWQGFLADIPDQPSAEAWLAERNFDDPANVYKHLKDLYSQRALSMMQASGRDRFDRFMPRLMAMIEQESAKAASLQRVLHLVTAVLRRSAYLVLLIENPAALAQLVKLCAASEWIADQLSKHPALLDELIDPRSLYSPPDRAQLADELRQATLRINRDDLEAQMEALRYFRMAHGLRVAASEVAGVLPLMKVSDYLTWLAEAVLEYVQQLTWEMMVARHGYPSQSSDPSLLAETAEFIVVGYGKLGGIELGHGSDLDLVFVHDTDINGQTDGERSIDNQTFYTRMGQKMIHILNTQTVSGQLYEVDMRLRPSGNSGMLVTSLNAFEKYQRGEAWTWEQQALVRGRVVCGNGELAQKFEQLRLALLCVPRDLPKLAEDVVTMREKMRTSLGSGNKAGFHLKQDAGGIVDIEFMVQYAALAWAHQVPALVRYSDNIRILGCLEDANLMATEDVASLIRAYKAYRSMGHALALQRQSVTLDDSQFRPERTEVEAIWQRLLGPSPIPVGGV